MKKFFSLVLALVMALSLTTVAFAATTEETDLQTDLNAGGTVTLTGDVVVEDGLTVPAGKTVVLDLAGYTISSNVATTLSSSFAVIQNKGTLTIKDSGTGGKISLSYGGASFGYGIGLYTISNEGGTLNIEGGTVENLCTVSSSMYDAIDNNSTLGDTVLNISGGNIYCSYIAIRQFANSTTHENIVNVTGGAVEGGNCSIWTQNPNSNTNNADIDIAGGSFTGRILLGDSAAFAATVSGGTFDTDVSEYVVDGKQLLANGTVVATPAASATDPVLYKWDNAGAEWDAYFIATGDDLDDLKMDASDNCLPCYKINGEYFVEVKEAVATFKLVYGAKTVFLTSVAAEDVCYSAKASVLKVVDDEDATCGDWYVADLDEDDVYYISYDKKGVVVEGVYVAAKNGPVQILVKGKIVDVKSLTQADIKQLPHDWKGYDVVNHEYTTVKCANCGKVATLYANGTAAGKNAVKVSDNGTVLGYITAAADSFGAASAGTSTDKVTSAETFDAGIAMYVGMSVMAAAGSVVVLKKRED